MRAKSQSQTRRPQTCLAAWTERTRNKSSGEGVFMGWPATLTMVARWNNPLHFEVNSVEAGLDRPLDLEQVGAGGAVEGALVS